jgi:hypothetical protein
VEIVWIWVHLQVKTRSGDGSKEKEVRAGKAKTANRGGEKQLLPEVELHQLLEHL